MAIAMTVCALSLSAQPQTRGGAGQRQQFAPETRAAMQTERMNKEVGLSKEQAIKVKALYLERYQQRQAERPQQRGQRAEPRQAAPGTQRPAMQPDTAFARRLNEILTPEQSAKWTETQKKMHEAMTNNRNGNRRPSGPGGSRGR